MISFEQEGLSDLEVSSLVMNSSILIFAGIGDVVFETKDPIFQ